MTYTFIIAFILFGILLIGLYYIIENRKAKRFFSIMDNKQSEKIENVSGREIERVGRRTYYNLSYNLTIYINGRFCALVRHSDSLMKKFYIPIIITTVVEVAKEFDFLPCFNLSVKEIETGNNLKLLLTNIKYPSHTKEITLSRLKESDLEKLKNIVSV